MTTGTVLRHNLGPKPERVLSALDMAAESFLSAKTAERCTALTLRAYRRAVTRCVVWLKAQGITDPQGITAARIRAYLAHLTELGLKASSVHHFARPVKTWCRFLYADGVIASDPWARVKLPRVPDEVLPAFTADEVRALLGACKGGADSARDTALLLCLLDTGCRAAEFCALKVADVDLSSGAITVRQGKGNKSRTVYIGSKARRAMRRYQSARAASGGDPLFPSLNTGDRLTTDGLRHLLLRLGKRAGVSDCHPHKFRRTFALSCLRAGMSIYALQRLMGHADLGMLRKYLALVEADLADAHREHGAVDSLLETKGR